MTTYTRTRSATLAFPDTAVVNCLCVTTSPQSTVAGVPVAVLGVVYFLGLGAMTMPALWYNRAHWVRLFRISAWPPLASSSWSICSMRNCSSSTLFACGVPSYTGVTLVLLVLIMYRAIDPA